MSSARRHKHSLMVGLDQNQRRLKRRGQFCHDYHWRRLLASISVEAWHKPYTHKVRVAVVSGYCDCGRRSSFYVAAVITMDEERLAPTLGGLRGLGERRIADAREAATRFGLPRHARNQ